MRVLLLLCFFITSILFSQDKRLALVIGNSNYDSLVDLKNPVNDAKLIAKTLDFLDFDVIQAYDLDFNSFYQKIEEFADKRKNYDVGFFYYAGHGLQIEGDNYLLPINNSFDKKWKIKSGAIKVNDILEYLTSITDQVNILILDACRNNPLEEVSRGSGDSDNDGLATQKIPTGSIIGYSAESGKRAYDGNGVNSDYSLSLSKNMRKENISIDQVFRNVRTEVLGLSNNNQRPIESSQLTGQAFYLFKSDYKNEFNYVESILENLNNAYFNETDYKPQLFKSLKKLNVILSEESSNERALLLSAKVYNELDQEDKALEITNSVIEVNTEYAAAYSFRSNLYNQLYWKTGEIKYRELEEKDENKLIELDPQDIYSYYTIISRNLRDNKYNKGIEIIEKALLSHPKDEELYRYKAIFHAYLWQNELALKYYDKAIELDPENGFYYMQKGDFLARDLERHQEAIELFQKANNLKSDEPSPYVSMILSYFTINKLDKIVELSEKLTAIDTDVPSSYYYLSNYYKRKEEYSKAITYLSLAIFKKIENNYVIQGLEYSGVHLSDLFLERSKLYDVLGIKIFECEDLNKGLEYVIKLESLGDEELKSPEIEFWDDKSQLMKIKLEIEELISKNCGL